MKENKEVRHGMSQFLEQKNRARREWLPQAADPSCSGHICARGEVCPSLWEMGGWDPLLPGDVGRGPAGFESVVCPWETDLVPGPGEFPSCPARIFSSVQPTQPTLQPQSPTLRQVLNSSHLNYLPVKGQRIRNLNVHNPGLQGCANTEALQQQVGFAGQELLLLASPCTAVCAHMPSTPPRNRSLSQGGAGGMGRFIWRAEEQLKDGATPGCSSFPLSFVLVLT